MSSKEKIHNLVESFSNMKALVIGDVMTDEYVFGKVERISPEAPVPVVHITGKEQRPGGAANVAINIRSLGAKAVLCSIAGNDDRGHEFISLLNGFGIESKGMMLLEGRKSTVKTRVIGNKHQLLRIDDERIEPLQGQEEDRFIQHCLSTIESDRPDVIIFEDYDKGVITPKLIAAVTESAKTKGIPVTVDPKIKNFGTYVNVSLFKPNFGELLAGTGIKTEKRDLNTLLHIAHKFMEGRSIGLMMVTLSDAGVFITNGREGMIVPAHVRNISDVSGAGDTVISVASLCLAAGMEPGHIAALSNLAGGLVCEEIGVVPVKKDRFITEAIALNL